MTQKPIACPTGPKRAFTLIELLVVIAIIAILAAILFPVFAKARQRAQASTCQSHLKQLGVAFDLYLSDNDDVYPPTVQWKTRVQPYFTTTDICRCPSRPNLPWYYGQGYNIGCDNPAVPGFAGKMRDRIRTPAQKILVAEWDRCNSGPPCGPTGLFANGATSWWAVSRVHTGGSNLLFGDGHVRWMRPDEYHSNTDHIDATGQPLGKNGALVRAVDETVWRRYWDTSYGG